MSPQRAAISLLALSVSLVSGASTALGQVTDLKQIQAPPLHAFHPETPKRIELSNGMVIFLQEDAELPLIRGTAQIRGGSRDEPAEKVRCDVAVEEISFLLVAVGTQARVAGSLTGTPVEDRDYGGGDLAETFGELAEVAGAAGDFFVEHREPQHGLVTVRVGARPVESGDFILTGLQHDPAAQIEGSADAGEVFLQVVWADVELFHVGQEL